MSRHADAVRPLEQSRAPAQSFNTPTAADIFGDDVATNASTSSDAAASPLLLACRTVASRVAHQGREGGGGGASLNSGGASEDAFVFCIPQLLHKFGSVLDCQQTMMLETIHDAHRPSWGGGDSRWCRHDVTSIIPNSQTSSWPRRSVDDDARDVSAAAFSEPSAEIRSTLPNSPAASTMHASDRPRHITLPQQPEYDDHAMPTVDKKKKTVPARTGELPNETTTSAPFSSSMPFTDGEPIGWVVPPGVADVCVADMAVQWTLTAGSQFTSILSNASVVRGKWMYEVTLGSSGLLQVGWSGPMHLFPWTPRLGVGDFPFTVAFDGHRQQLWNVRATHCGHRWAPGDVITCCMDLEEGEASFYQNGEFVGAKKMITAATAEVRAAELRRSLMELGFPASHLPSSSCGGGGGGGRRGSSSCVFALPHSHNHAQHGSTTPSSGDDAIGTSYFYSDADRGGRGGASPASPFTYDTSLCYSPALSLGQYETAIVNLGRAPFRFPIPGYKPIDARGAVCMSMWRARAPLLMDVEMKPYRSTMMLALVQQLRLPWSGGAAEQHNLHGFAMMVVQAFLLLQEGNPSTQRPVHADDVCPACSPSRAPSSTTTGGRPSHGGGGGVPRAPSPPPVPLMHHLCPMCSLLTLLQMCLQPDEFAAVATIIASYCATSAASRRCNTSSCHAWTASPELRILQICTTRSAAFRQTWAHSPQFCSDVLNVFRIKTPNNYDLMSLLFPASPDRTATMQRRRQGCASPPTFEQREHTSVCVEAEEPLPSVMEAHEDHEVRSAVLHECVIRLDDDRRAAILDALLDCPLSEGPTVTAVSVAVDELRQLLAANVAAAAAQQQRTAGGGMLPPPHLRPRTSEVCVDSAVAARLFFCLIRYIGRYANEIRCEAMSTASRGGVDPAQAVRCALRDVFLPSATLREPLVEGVEFTRLGGAHSSVLRSLVAANPHLLDQTIRPAPGGEGHPRRSARSTLFVKSVILYSAAVKELVISACGDMLLRHRQREAWRSHDQAINKNRRADHHPSPCVAPSPSPSQTSPPSSPPTLRSPPAQPHGPPSPNEAVHGTTTVARRRLSEVAANRLLLDMLVSGRSCAWSMATLFLLHQQWFDDMGAFCALISEVISAYDGLAEYPLIPIVFVECFVDVWHFTRKTAPNYVGLVQRFPQNIQFFVERVLDPRIAHVETNEYLLLSLAGILDTVEAHREVIAQVLSQHRPSWSAAMRRLLRQFEHPLGWPLSVGVWTKLGVGNYFCLVELEEDSAEWNAAFPSRRRAAAAAALAPSTDRKPPSAFAFHREFFSQSFLSDPQTARLFFRQLVTHCHYCVSELGVSISAVWEHYDEVRSRGAAAAAAAASGGGGGGSTQEPRNHHQNNNNNNRSNLSPQEYTVIRRRCGAVFELTRKVLHILEFCVEAGRHVLFPVPSTSTSSRCPQGTAGNNHPDAGGLLAAEKLQNLQLLLELWTQAISRFAPPTSTIARITDAVIAQQQQQQQMSHSHHTHLMVGLERLRQWKLLAPLVGVLYAMVDGGGALDATLNPFLQRLRSGDYTWPMDGVVHMLRGFNWTEMNAHVPWCKAKQLLQTPSPPPPPPHESGSATAHGGCSSRVETALLRAFQHLCAGQGVGSHSSSSSGPPNTKGGLPPRDDDDGLVDEGTCHICMIRAADTLFAPCGHVSCIDCINRHMSSGHNKCFWCSRPVTGLRPVPT